MEATNKAILIVKQFCTANEVRLEELINTGKKGGILSELRKDITRKLVDKGCSFAEVAAVFKSRTQLVKYYYYAPPLKNKELEIEKLERKLGGYKKKVEELTSWLMENTGSKEYCTIASDKNHYQNKVATTLQKITNLQNSIPKLGYPDPETKWNGYKNGNPIY